MAKTETKNTKKVPGALVAAVVVVVAIAAFVPTVYIPYKNKKPAMDAAHQEALDTIAYLDSSIENQAAIEADIDDLEKQWAEYEKNMFVNANAALSDLVEAIDGCGIVQTSYSQGDPMPDESGTVTAEGNPLYYMGINLSGNATREDLLKFLKYVEQDSVGCYYVQTLNTTPYDVYDTEGENAKVVEERLNFSMTIILYYFNQDIVQAPPVEEEAPAE